MIRTDDGRLTTTAARTLLVVDDDPSISRLLRRYLSGYSVLGVTTQPEAFGLATMVLPDAIVAPPASVDALLSRLKDLPFDIPIISCALSKMASGPHFDSVAAIITKPVAAETIARVVAHLSLAPDSTILLVDDDPDAVRLLEAQLASKADGFRVLKAYNGEQALDIMRDVVPSLVAMDLVMPGIDGEETIKRMSASDRLRHVPVVVVSGEVAKESEAVVHSPISVHLRETMSLGQYVECLQLLLDVLVVRRARVPTLS
jgi:CheY-like chemotaxis protein